MVDSIFDTKQAQKRCPRFFKENEGFTHEWVLKKTKILSTDNRLSLLQICVKQKMWIKT
jgi:hypothetical protein